MPNDQHYIVCPYYHKALGNIIFCEAFPAAADLQTEQALFKQSFSDRNIRNHCLERYCTGFNYLDCRIAALNQTMLAGDTK